MYQGSYLTIFIIAACFIVWPEDTKNAILAAGLKIQLYYVNWRMKRQAKRMHAEICKMAKECGFPEPGPFRFVNIWDREPLD